MAEIKLITHWTKKGDAEKLQRIKIWAANNPPTGSITPVENLLLQLPPPPADASSAAHEIELEEEREEITEAELPALVALVRAKHDEQKAAKTREIQKAVYITSWSSQHGSSRLQKQLVLGYSGWPLYLHERLAYDFLALAPLVPLINNARGNHEMTVNPTEAQLEAEEQIAEHLVALHLAPDLASACKSTRIVQGSKSNLGAKEKSFFVLCDAYRPGPKELFEKAYEIIFPLDPAVEREVRS
jgi:hypothetical protein